MKNSEQFSGTSVKKFKSVNLHICEACNYCCDHCFSRNLSTELLTPLEWVPILEQLRSIGIEKVNFAGGEPLLYPWFKEICTITKSMGFVVSVVSNGSLIDESFIEEMEGVIDWIGLSIDSPNNDDEISIGRHCDGLNHIEHVCLVSDIAHKHGMKVKLNITAVRRSCTEDFRPLIDRIGAERVKVFRALTIKGANDLIPDTWSISDQDFERFKSLHRGCKNIVFEDNDDMVGTYLMLDPMGRWMTNNCRIRNIQEFKEMMEEGVESKLDVERYYARQGADYWNEKEVSI